MEQLLRTLNFSGRISVLVQNGRFSSPGTRRDFFGNARLEQIPVAKKEGNQQLGMPE
jgi:hypothetical protein